MICQWRTRQDTMMRYTLHGSYSPYKYITHHLWSGWQGTRPNLWGKIAGEGLQQLRRCNGRAGLRTGEKQKREKQAQGSIHTYKWTCIFMGAYMRKDPHHAAETKQYAPTTLLPSSMTTASRQPEYSSFVRQCFTRWAPIAWISQHHYLSPPALYPSPPPEVLMSLGGTSQPQSSVDASSASISFLRHQFI